MSTVHTVHLVDASPYIFRAWFSLPDSMRAEDGSPSNAVYGFCAFLLRFIQQEEPTHLALAFDESLTTSFRNEIYPDYKAQRVPPPPELEAQQQACQEVAAALGAHPQVSKRYEADDLIGTLVRRLEPEGHSIVIVSSDKDLAQFVSDRVTLFDFARQRLDTPETVRRRLGVPPHKVVDLLALAGDSVDNIPGVAGIGAITAARLLETFESVEDLYERLEQVADLAWRGASAAQKKLAAGREQAELSKRLASMALDAPAPHSVEELRFAGADRQLVEPLFPRLGIAGLTGRITRWRPEDQE